MVNSEFSTLRDHEEVRLTLNPMLGKGEGMNGEAGGPFSQNPFKNCGEGEAKSREKISKRKKKSLGMAMVLR